MSVSETREQIQNKKLLPNYPPAKGDTESKLYILIFVVFLNNNNSYY
jgi:hypothetical protein